MTSALSTGAPYVERMLLRNFRGIANCEIEFEPTMTVLAGRNNVGKSRILSALYLALGGRPPEIDDFTVGIQAQPEVDLIVAPAPPVSNTDDDEFSTSVARLFGDSVQSLSEEPARERIAWRTTVSPSAEGMGARADARILTFDARSSVWAQRSDAQLLTRTQRSILSVDLINTGRDLLDELNRRGSSIRRILSDLEIPGSQSAALEERLLDLSKSILGESETLKSVRSALDDLHKAVGSIGSPSLNPLPANLDELARLISIGLDTGNGPLPMRLHGAGSRSLASLQVQGVLYDRRLGRDGTALRPSPITLVEEPEAHLHPQAAMELAALLGSLQGQKVVTTHSAHLITSVDHSSVRLLRTGKANIEVIDLGPASSLATATHRAFRPDLHADEIEKLKRLVERPFGELIFATAMVLGDGATERAFLPAVIRHALGGKAHGICVVDPGSLNNELATAAVKFAQMTSTPWVLFADSDVDGQMAVAKLLSLGHSDSTRVIWINGVDSDGNPVDGAIESLLLQFDEGMCRRACLEVRPDLASQATLPLMKKLKGSSGASLAQHLISEYPDASVWPLPLKTLLERLESEL